MTDPTLIGDLIRAGIDPDLISRVVAALVDASVRRQSADVFVDVQAEKRRAADRERQRIRRLSADCPQTPQMSAKTPLLLEDNSKNLSKKERGCRLSADWLPSEDDLSFATEKGMPRPRIDIESEKFRNYWTAKAGTAATKRDWPATWRNWVLSSLERSPGIPLIARADAEPVWAKPPPGFKPIDEILRERDAAANGTKVRGDTGLGENGRDHGPQLPLPS